MKIGDTVQVDTKLWNEWRDALDGDENLEGVNPDIQYQIDDVEYRYGGPYLIHLITDPSGVFRRPYWFRKCSH